MQPTRDRWTNPVPTALGVGLGLGAAALTLGGLVLADRVRSAAARRRAQARAPVPTPDCGDGAQWDPVAGRCVVVPYEPEPAPEPVPEPVPETVALDVFPVGLFDARFRSIDPDPRFRRSTLAGEGLIGFVRPDELPVRVGIEMPEGFSIELLYSTEDMDPSAEIVSESERAVVVDVHDLVSQTDAGHVTLPSFSGRIRWSTQSDHTQIGNDHFFQIYVVDRFPPRARA